MTLPSLFESFLRRMGGDQPLPQRRTQVFTSEPQPPRPLTAAWNGRVTPPAPQPTAPALPDFDALKQWVCDLGQMSDHAARSTRGATSTADYRRLRGLELAARDQLFGGLAEAVGQIWAWAAYHDRSWLDLQDLGFFSLSERLRYTDAMACRVWDWLCAWNDRGLSDDQRIDRGLTCRLLELHLYVYRGRFQQSFAAVDAILPARRRRPDGTAISGTSWIDAALAAMEAASTNGQLLTADKVAFLRAGLRQPAAPPLDLAQGAQSGQTLLAQVGNSWDEAKKRYLPNHAASMRDCLAYRQWLLEPRVEHAVRIAMRQHGVGRWVTGNAAGSTTLSSDIDLTLDGDATERTVIAFNMAFVESFGLESGYMLDLNVYARGYLGDPGYRSCSDDEPSEDFRFRGTGAHGARRAFQADQDAAALLKIRRYIPETADPQPGLWLAFRARVEAGLRDGPRQRFQAAATLAEQRQAEYSARLAGLRQSEAALLAARMDPVPPAAVEMAASNRAYEAVLVAQMEQVAAIRRATTEGERNAAIVKFYEYVAEHSYFANEAYHTAGAIRHVVGQLQSQQSQAMSLAALLDSLNEQVGDVLKELAHLSHDGQLPELGQGDAASAGELKLSKYIARFGIAAQTMIFQAIHFNHRARTPDDLAALSRRASAVADYGRALLALKERGQAGNTGKLGQLRSDAGLRDLSSLVELLVYWGADVNVAIRQELSTLDLFTLPALPES